MTKKFFGIIKKKDINNIEDDDIMDNLINIDAYDNVFNPEYISKFMKNGSDIGICEDLNDLDDCTIMEPSIPLINEFFDFLCERYKQKLNYIKFNYIAEFNDLAYGLPFGDKKNLH